MTESSTPSRIYLDSNIFITLLEGMPEKSERLKPLFEKLRERRNFAVTSELTLAEVLVGPVRNRNPILHRAYLDLIVFGSFIELWPISRDVLYESVRLRVAHERVREGLPKLPDAIHLVSAIQTRCRFFLSDDQRVSPPQGMDRMSADAKGIEDLLATLA
jgi:predicted nucleic acid-binding protein